MTRLLCDFPPELVCLVTDYLDSFSVTRLWMTGNKRIEHLFKRGGVQQLTWQIPYPVCPPVFALQLPYLSKLTLSFDAKDPYPCTETYLNALPSSLRALSLSGIGFDQDILSWLSSASHQLPLLQTLQIPLTIRISDDLQLKLPPGLTSLTIRVEPNSDGTALQLPHLTELNFYRDVSKPLVSLDHLKALQTFVSPYDIKFSSLPPNLLHLTLDSDGISEFFHLLPKTLESLDFQVSSFNALMISKIPRNVRFLRFGEVPLTQIEDEDVLWDLECIQALPPRLTSLDAPHTRYEDELDLGALLPHLLLFTPLPYNFMYSSEVIRYLDDQYYDVDGEKVKRTTLPPNLTFLGTEQSNHIKVLPMLPDSIKHLRWGLIQWNSLPIRFPSGLVSFTAKICSYTGTNLQNSTDGKACFLPPSVTEVVLDIDQVLDPAPFFSPNLVKLTLKINDGWHKPSSEAIANRLKSWPSCLPTTLSALDIFFAKSLDDEFFRHLYIPNVTKLALRGISKSCTICQRLDSLPRDLVELELYLNSEVDWKTMKLLQFTKLKQLTIRTQLAHESTSSFTVDMFPRKLTTVVASDCLLFKDYPRKKTMMRENHIELKCIIESHSHDYW